MLRLMLAMTLCGYIASTASADLFFQFGQNDYSVAPNQTVDIDVFLTQNDPTGDPASLVTDGLISGGVRVFFNDILPIEPAFVATLSDITPNGLFDDTLLGQELFLDSGISAGFVDGVDNVSAPLRGTQILLGTFRFTAGGQVGDVTNLIATDLRATEDIIAGNSTFSSLDSFTANGLATITVSAVPEPSSAICLALVLATAIFGKRVNGYYHGVASSSESIIAKRFSSGRTSNE